jgi:outer membrane protein assembly factor BamB
MIHRFKWYRSLWSVAAILSTTALPVAGDTFSRSAQAGDGEKHWCGFQNCGQGIDFELPISWGAAAGTVAWQSDIKGYGQSSPVVYAETVFATSTSGDNKDMFHVSAFDLQTGESLWTIDFDNPTLEENNSYVSRSAPSPVVDANGLYVFNEGGFLAALDHGGSLLWKRDLVAEFGPIKARHGLASSLEQDKDSLYVWVERGDSPYLMSVSKKTGQTLWKSAGLGATTWGSPRLIDVDGRQHLVCSASGRVVGFDPSTGDRLWELTGLANNTSSTPMPVSEGRFFISASDGRGEESAANAQKSNGLVEVTRRENGSYQADFLWRAEKASCSFGSPIVAGGKVWLVNRTGALYQLDLQTGAQLSVERVKAGSIWASPLSDSKHVFFFGQKGTTSVIDIVTGNEVATNSLWESTPAVPGEPAVTSDHVQYAAVASQGSLLIRRGDRLYAIRH